VERFATIYYGLLRNDTVIKLANCPAQPPRQSVAAALAAHRARSAAPGWLAGIIRCGTGVNLEPRYLAHFITRYYRYREFESIRGQLKITHKLPLNVGGADFLD
jgi:hypothetical protein